MPIRPATINDLPVISSIYADGFWDEEFIGHTINPHRQEHSQDYLDFWKRRVLESYWDYSHKLMVFYLDGEEDAGEEGEKEVVVGAADWHRLGQGWEKVWAVKGWWDIRNLIKPIVTVRNRIVSTIWPNRAADPAKHDLESHMYSFVRQIWSGPRANCWDLACLAVVARHRKRGYGRQLVGWGLEQAEREGVVASVLSADGKEAFYQRCGYGPVVGRATDGEGNRLAGRIRGGAIMFRDVEGERSQRPDEEVTMKTDRQSPVGAE